MSFPSIPTLLSSGAVLACQAESTMAVPCMHWVGSLATVAIAFGLAASAAALPPGRDRAPVALPAAPAAAPSSALSADDALQAAHDAARLGDRDLLASFAPRVAGHLLEDYYEYWKVSLAVRSGETDDTAVRTFLERYPGTYLSDRLRADWLLALGSRGEYGAFGAQLRELIWNHDDMQIRCFATLSAYALEASGLRDALAREARSRLSRAADPGGDGCTA